MVSVGGITNQLFKCLSHFIIGEGIEYVQCLIAVGFHSFFCVVNPAFTDYHIDHLFHFYFVAVVIPDHVDQFPANGPAHFI